MRNAWIIGLVLMLCAPAAAYDCLREAFSARPPRYYPGDLPKDAIQYIIDACSLRWPDYNPLAMRGASPISAHVSSNGRYCVITRPFGCPGCSGADGEVALIDTKGLRWTRAGKIAASAVVSADGSIAVFLWERSSFPGPHSLRLLTLTSTGDTLVTREWHNYPGRPFRSGDFDEVFAFSPDGRFLLYTMNTAFDVPAQRDEYNNTVLHCVAVATGSEHVADLGAFRPSALQFSSEGATLSGHGGLYPLDESRGQVYWNVRFSPWKLKKHVKW